MSGNSRMQRVCESYIRRAGFYGVLLGVVPTLLWFGGMFVFLPFRSVYLLRLGLSLLLAGAAGAFLNRRGLSYWLIKHRSAEGPASLADGLVVGAWIGMGIALLPPLTHFIDTYHPEEVKNAVIGAWLGAALLGGLIGLIFAGIGRKHVART